LPEGGFFSMIGIPGFRENMQAGQQLNMLKPYLPFFMAAA